MNVSEVILEALKDIKANGPSHLDSGICHNVELLVTKGRAIPTPLETMQKMQQLFRNWPNYSDDPSFPIPHPKKPESQYCAYMKLSTWSKRGEYGRSRWALVDWMIEQLEKELAECLS